MDILSRARPVMLVPVAAAMALALFATVALNENARTVDVSRPAASSHATLAALDRLVLCLLRAEAAQLPLPSHNAVAPAGCENAMSEYVATAASTEIAGLKERPHGPPYPLLARLDDHALYRQSAQPVDAAGPAPEGVDVPRFSLIEQIRRRISSIDMRPVTMPDREEEHRQPAAQQPVLLLCLQAIILCALSLCILQAFRQHRHAGNILQSAHAQLEAEMRQRTDALESANRMLVAENAERKRANLVLSGLQDKLRQMHARQELVREEERKHIAREVHDGLGQDLYALRIAIARLLPCSGPPGSPLHQQLADVLQHMDSLMKSVRSVIRNLRPEALDLGPVAAMRWQTQEFGKRSGIRCNFIAETNDITLGEEAALALFRILQEALANVLRHAQASHVAVTLRVAGEMLFMSVVDDGCGFAPEDGRRSTSFGLLGIGERMQALQGTLKIVSAPGNGTSLVVAIPLSPPKLGAA